MNKSLLKNLAAQGDSGAMLAYGIVCAAELKTDLDEAIAWCELAGENGISFGHLAAATLVQENIAGRYEEALDLLRRAAKNGSSAAMYRLALSLEALADKNASKEAIYWYREAALRSHASSACRMGDLVDNGNVTAEEAAPHSAIEWYELAGHLGDSHAAFRLGEAYSDGIGVSKDVQWSRHWFEVSAILGNSMAHRLLAFEYSAGRPGFPVSPSLAEFHEKRAEECSRLESIEQKIRRRIIERME